MQDVRLPAVAGSFYPGDAALLLRTVRGLLERPAALDDVPATAAPRPLRALIAPHAGYTFSGAVAAAAYALLAGNQSWSTVAIVGPAHHVAFHGFAAPQSTVFATPLGELQIDADLLARLAARLPIVRLEAAHAPEHCIETQLPFLQVALGAPRILPLLVSATEPAHAQQLVEALADHDVLVIVSSDLSHFHPQQEARRIDRATATAVVERRAVDRQQACGAAAINGVLAAARARGWRLQLQALRTSGDVQTPGNQPDLQRVVGYGAFVAGG